MNDPCDISNHEPITTEPQPCVTDQWNFPYPRTMPWARDGVCSICDQPVEMMRVSWPDNTHLYTHISKPHTRLVTWYRVKDHDLRDLIEWAQR